MKRFLSTLLIFLLLTAQVHGALSDNLESCWAMDESSGNNAADSVGTNVLTQHNTVGAAAGKISGARDFEDSSSNYLNIGDNASIRTGDIDFSFILWVNPESLSGSFPGLAGKDNIAVAREWVLYLDSSASYKPTLEVFNGGTTNRGTVAWGSGLSTSTWYFIVVWHDAVNNQIGISVNNGTPVTASTSGALGTSASDFNVGAILNNSVISLFFDGLIDEMAFFKRVLTAGDITDLYNSGSGRACSYIASTTTPANFYRRRIQ